MFNWRLWRRSRPSGAPESDVSRIKMVNIDVVRIAHRAGLPNDVLAIYHLEMMRFPQALTREIMGHVTGATETPLDDVPKAVREELWRLQHGGDDRAA